MIFSTYPGILKVRSVVGGAPSGGFVSPKINTQAPKIHATYKDVFFTTQNAHQHLTNFAPGFIQTAPFWTRFVKKLFCTILGSGFTGKFVKNIAPANKKRRPGILQRISLSRSSLSGGSSLSTQSGVSKCDPEPTFYTRRGSG